MSRPMQSIMDSMIRGANSDNFSDEGHKDDGEMYSGSSIQYKIFVNHDQSHGTIHHMTFTVDPQMTVASFKCDLAYVTKIPVEFVKLIHRNKTLDDDKTLREQGVKHNDFIVLTANPTNLPATTHTI